MKWEDLIFTAAQVCFGVSLLGMLRSEHKPPTWSAAMYSFWVWAITAADIGLTLPLATATAAINAAMWTALTWQSWHVRYVLRRRIIRYFEEQRQHLPIVLPKLRCDGCTAYGCGVLACPCPLDAEVAANQRLDAERYPNKHVGIGDPGSPYGPPADPSAPHCLDHTERY